MSFGVQPTSGTENLLIRLANAPGDTIVLTAAVRDLALQYPDRFSVSVDTHANSVWHGNPHVVPVGPSPRVLQLKYGGQMRRAHGGVRMHFLQAFHNLLNEELGTDIKMTEPKPDLHLTPEDVLDLGKNSLGKYWVLFPGWKSDMPTKAWLPSRWQTVVDVLDNWGVSCVQVGATSKGHHNPTLLGVTNLVGKTKLRQLFRLIADSEGVICGVTSGMHIAAAFDKPCVSIAGGREAWWWEAYVNQNTGFGAANGRVVVPHRFLHTQGLLTCCERSGCCRRKTNSSQTDNQRDVCLQMQDFQGSGLPACMGRIEPEDVVDGVLSYYLDRTLVPHSSELKKLTATLPDTLPAVGDPLTILGQDGRTVRISFGPRQAESAEQRRPEDTDVSVFQDPNIGDRVTICLLMYGDFAELHKRCLNAVLATTPKDRVELRVGGNQLCRETDTYLRKLHESGDIAHLNISSVNRRKYPVMRDLFREPPLTTNWVIWLDDDTLCDTDSGWLVKMLGVASANFDRNCRWVGPHYKYRMNDSWREWCAQGGWYRSLPWPEDNKIGFATGSLWMAHVPTLLAADVPDCRLGHNKGDVTVGCQFHQAGVKLCNFSAKKETVNWSSSARRGITDRHPAE